MPQVVWSANPRSEYWIDDRLGSYPLQVLVDTGLIDSRGQVGFSVDEAFYDRLKQAGEFQSHQIHARLNAAGLVALTESGLLDAQLIFPQTRSPVGPLVRISVFRGVPGVPNRVGLAFFHHLKGCKVLWDLDQRTWCIEHP